MSTYTDGELKSTLAHKNDAGGESAVAQTRADSCSVFLFDHMGRKV